MRSASGPPRAGTGVGRVEYVSAPRPSKVKAPYSADADDIPRPVEPAGAHPMSHASGKSHGLRIVRSLKEDTWLDHLLKLRRLSKGSK